MEVIFPLRAQTQYWISLEAFFCVWNLSPISPPDTDDFHRATGETACAGVCPLCGKRGKSALIGFYIHIRQRGCKRSSQRRVTPTEQRNCVFYCYVLSTCAIDWLAVWAALVQKTVTGPFASLSVLKLWPQRLEIRVQFQGKRKTLKQETVNWLIRCFSFKFTTTTSRVAHKCKLISKPIKSQGDSFSKHMNTP